MQLRVARHTERLDAIVAFYRDAVGLAETGRFSGHDGYDGVFLEVPGTGAHLELTAGGPHGAPQPHPETLLVLYLENEASVQAVVGRVGAEPVAPANPYWAQHGLTFEDPDGFRVVLVAERWEGRAPSGDIEIGWHDGEREPLRDLFALAEDSPQRLEASFQRGRVLAAADGREIAGYLQLVETDRPGEMELLSMAVAERRQRQGLGRALVMRAISECRREGVRTLLVATAAAGTGNLRFYQRLGFRMLRVERDAFTPAAGYPDGITSEGIPLRDRIWLSLTL